MRIGIISPVEIRIPPVGYGGIELVVSILTEELVSRGNDVTLFASGDSVTSARLVSVVPEYLRKSNTDPRFFSYKNMIECFEREEEFDIIHNHLMGEGLLAAGLVKTPTLTTLHGPISGKDILAFKYYKGWYNTISKSALNLLTRKEKYSGVVYNAIDCSRYAFNGGARDDYLLYLSRFSPEKGAHIAIQVARRLNRRLILAGNLADEEYFKDKILPFVDGKNIVCEIEVDDDRKKSLLSNASCLLAPILWDEPFGLFMVEALACGTPVVAFNRGAAPELIQDQKTGFVVENIEQMVDSVKKIDYIDPRKCRQHVLKNFDTPVMAANYLDAYRRVLTSTKKLDTAPEILLKN